MKDLDKHIQKQRNLIYEPLCRMFFEKLNELHVSDECLAASSNTFAIKSLLKFFVTIIR